VFLGAGLECSGSPPGRSSFASFPEDANVFVNFFCVSDDIVLVSWALKSPRLTLRGIILILILILDVLQAGFRLPVAMALRFFFSVESHFHTGPV